MVTWATAQPVYRAAPAAVPPPAAPQAPPAAATAGQPAPAANGGGRGRGPTSFNNQTVRMVAHTSIGGRRLRLQFTNPFGSKVVVVGAAHLAIRDKDSGIVPASDRVVTVGGNKSFRLLAGATMFSDPVDLEFPALADLAISLYFPQDTGPTAAHTTGLHTTFISEPGDFTGQTQITGGTTANVYYWVSAIDVLAPASTAAIVTLGDSITDGTSSTVNADHSWPARLAVRLQANKPTASLGVANEGISGNRVLADGSGVAALARLDHDVLAQSGVKWLMLLESINDIGLESRTNTGLTAADLTAAYRQIVERAHTRGIKVVGCTLTPYQGAAYYSEPGETMREAVNDFIRSSGTFDAVADFDAAVRDPANPKHYRVDMQSGDNLHPSDAGYQAMADAVSLSIFTAK